jgi:large subunit ribosomal protein L3
MANTVQVDLPAEIFDVQTNVPLLHQVVVAQLAAARQGTHKNHRKPGSIGGASTPSRVFKGMKMAGRMGAVRHTTLNLTVHAVDVEKSLLLIKGAVPGARGQVVLVRTAVKGA